MRPARAVLAAIPRLLLACAPTVASSIALAFAQNKAIDGQQLLLTNADRGQM